MWARWGRPACPAPPTGGQVVWWPPFPLPLPLESYFLPAFASSSTQPQELRPQSCPWQPFSYLSLLSFYSDLKENCDTELATLIQINVIVLLLLLPVVSSTDLAELAAAFSWISASNLAKSLSSLRICLSTFKLKPDINY